MDALRLIISNRALRDLKDIGDYIAIKSHPATADRVSSEILDACARLTEMPGMGHVRPDLPDPFRVWRVFKFLIIYRFDHQAIHVARVMHGHRDLRQHFRE